MKKILSFILIFSLIFSNILYAGMSIRSFDIAKDVEQTIFWADAADETTISLRDDTYITQVNDKSGNGYNPSQATEAYQPVYTLNGLNGKPVITFDGNDDYLQTGVISDFASMPFTEFIVLKFSTINSATVSHGGIDALHRIELQASTAWGGFFLWNGNVATFAGTPTNTNYLSINWNEIGSNDSDVYVNGGSKQTINAGSAGGTSRNGLTLGGIFDGTFNIDGYIAEHIICNDILPDILRLQIEAYLKNKWGI